AILRGQLATHEAPCGHVSRLFLQPDHFLDIRVPSNNLANRRILERGELLDTSNRDVFGAVALLCLFKIDRNLTTTEDEAGHLVFTTDRLRVIQHRLE